METPYPEKHYPLTASVDYPDRELNALDLLPRLRDHPDRVRARNGLRRSIQLWHRRYPTYIAAAGGICSSGPC